MLKRLLSDTRVATAVGSIERFINPTTQSITIV